MTTKEKLISMCGDYGMSDSQAKEVVELAIPELDKNAGNYKITWDRPAAEYPDALYNVMFFTVKKFAIEWIDKNCPAAWFRPMFL